MTHEDTEYLLPKVKRTLADHWTGWTYPDQSRTVSDEHGQVGIATTYNPRQSPTYERFVCAAKRSLHRDRYGSFMPKLVAYAFTRTRQTQTDHRLALFVGGREPYHVEDVYVFDALRVANQADARTYVDSKRDTEVEIFDVSVNEHAIGLGDYLGGRKRLPGPTTAGGTVPSTLKQYTGVEA